MMRQTAGLDLYSPYAKNPTLRCDGATEDTLWFGFALEMEVAR